MSGVEISRTPSACRRLQPAYRPIQSWKDWEYDSGVGALECRLRCLIQRNDLFATDMNVPLDELIAPGTMTGLQTDTLNRRDQQLITIVLLRRL